MADSEVNATGPAGDSAGDNGGTPAAEGETKQLTAAQLKKEAKKQEKLAKFQAKQAKLQAQQQAKKEAGDDVRINFNFSVVHRGCCRMYSCKLDANCKQVLVI